MTRTLTAIGVALWGLTASAYVTSGVKWSPAQIVVYLNPETPDMAPAQVEAALIQAMNVWNAQSSAPEQFAFVYGGRTSDAISQYDGKNIVWFDESGACTEYIAGTTTWVWGNADGSQRIVDGDVRICDQPYTFWPSGNECQPLGNHVYLSSVLVHELGHLLNLGHPFDHPEAVMYPAMASCDTSQLTLKPDDVAGFLFLYPVEPAPTEPTATDGGGATSPRKGNGKGRHK